MSGQSREPEKGRKGSESEAQPDKFSSNPNWRKRAAAEDFFDEDTRKRVDRHPGVTTVQRGGYESYRPIESHNRTQHIVDSTIDFGPDESENGQRRNIHPDRLRTNFQDANIRISQETPIRTQADFEGYHDLNGIKSQRHFPDDTRDNSVGQRPDTRSVSTSIPPEPRMASMGEGTDNATVKSSHGDFSSAVTPKIISAAAQNVASHLSARTEGFRSLMEAFAKYTDTVVGTATSAVRHDASRAKLDKQISEKDKWQRQYHGFVTMAEAQTGQFKRTESSSERSKEKLKRLRKDQKKAMGNMTSQVMSAASGTVKPGFDLDKDFNSSTNEVMVLKDKLHTTNEALEFAQSNIQRLQDKTHELRDSFVSIRAMRATETRIAEATVNISKLQAIVAKLDGLSNQVVPLQERMHDLSNRVLEIGRPHGAIQELSGKVNTLTAQIQRWQEDFAAQSKASEEFRGDADKEREKLNKLQVVVTGDGSRNEPGLVDFIKNGVERNVKHAVALAKLNDELSTLGSLTDEVGKLNVRISDLEPRVTTQVPEISTNSVTLSDLRKEMDEKIQTLFAECARISTEQIAKDDTVAEEVERLDSVIERQEVNITRVNDELSKMQSQNALTSLSNAPTLASPPHVDGNRMSEGPLPDRASEEPIRVKVEVLETDLKHFKESSTERTKNMEDFVMVQEQRFNNLTTEHLARSMLHQMQSLYPLHPGNIKAEFDSIKSRQASVDQHVTHLISGINALSERAALSETRDKAIKDIQTKMGEMAQNIFLNGSTAQLAVDEREDMKAHLHQLTTRIQVMEQDITQVKKKHQKTTSLAAAKEDLNTTDGNVDAISKTMVKEIAKLHADLATVNKRIDEFPSKANPQRSRTNVDMEFSLAQTSSGRSVRASRSSSLIAPNGKPKDQILDGKKNPLVDPKKYHKPLKKGRRRPSEESEESEYKSPLSQQISTGSEDD